MAHLLWFAHGASHGCGQRLQKVGVVDAIAGDCKQACISIPVCCSGMGMTMQLAHGQSPLVQILRVGISVALVYACEA